MPKVSDHYLEKRKKHIAKSAITVFNQKGYSSATMKDIMDAAGVSRGGLYAHFDNISSVFLAALKYDDCLAHNQFLTIKSEMPLFPQLKAWIERLELLTKNHEVGMVRAKSEFFLAHDISEVPYLRERHAILAKDIQLFIETGIESGEFSNTIDVKAFSELLISMLDGVLLHQYYEYAPNFESAKVFHLMNNMIEQFLCK